MIIPDFPPIDQAFLGLVIIGATVQLARALTAGMDRDIQATPEFKGLSAQLRNLIGRLLTGVHHWWIGGLILYYGSQGGHFAAACIGLGLMIDDYDDVPLRLKGILANIREGWTAKPKEATG